MDNAADEQIMHVEQLQPYYEAQSKDEEEVEVEEIIDSHNIKGGKEYLVKWKAYTTSFNEWLPEIQLENAQAPIERYKSDKKSEEEGKNPSPSPQAAQPPTNKKSKKRRKKCTQVKQKVQLAKPDE